jgi:hypothetical protein
MCFKNPVYRGVWFIRLRFYRDAVFCSPDSGSVSFPFLTGLRLW